MPELAWMNLSPCFYYHLVFRTSKASEVTRNPEAISCSSWTLNLEKGRKLLDPNELSVSKIKFHSGTCAWL